MSKKYYYIIPLFLLEVMIQLGFFWLAPECECRWGVYSFLTVMTIIHLVITFILMTSYGVRKAMTTIISGSFIQLVIIVASVLLLAFDVSVRSSVFSLLMLTILYTAIVAILWISIEGFNSNFDNTDPTDDYEEEYDTDLEHGCREYRPSRYESAPVERNRVAQPQNRPVERSTTKRTPPPIPVRH